MVTTGLDQVASKTDYDHRIELSAGSSSPTIRLTCTSKRHHLRTVPSFDYLLNLSVKQMT